MKRKMKVHHQGHEGHQGGFSRALREERFFVSFVPFVVQAFFLPRLAMKNS
jgi:hypothetical protein